MTDGVTVGTIVRVGMTVNVGDGAIVNVAVGVIVGVGVLCRRDGAATTTGSSRLKKLHAVNRTTPNDKAISTAVFDSTCWFRLGEVRL